MKLKSLASSKARRRFRKKLQKEIDEDRQNRERLKKLIEE